MRKHASTAWPRAFWRSVHDIKDFSEVFKCGWGCSLNDAVINTSLLDQLSPIKSVVCGEGNGDIPAPRHIWGPRFCCDPAQQIKVQVKPPRGEVVGTHADETAATDDAKTTGSAETAETTNKSAASAARHCGGV